ncbi:hypothetical protein HYPBUDRAFT_154108 [Hyphopichia burtonii NRRL Y-1933]|uniref:Uncharacterized protein n=1 Tax=Hyphopichia burtonii NRRL Y-1933 TaxID=984485 RepID=A0A1E4RDX1_9ASCO|nr:hypothetical protein HYPBUDRAFT_154108 [Hyphopichia burtonii NRRL Y-1933]ODV65315.1 hypothetical protein HYPBUDRAFT_154108 [Hyphopichia burtonii NRRL Y-1933]
MLDAQLALKDSTISTIRKLQSIRIRKLPSIRKLYAGTLLQPLEPPSPGMKFP